MGCPFEYQLSLPSRRGSELAKHCGAASTKILERSTTLPTLGRAWMARLNCLTKLANEPTTGRGLNLCGAIGWGGQAIGRDMRSAGLAFSGRKFPARQIMYQKFTNSLLTSFSEKMSSVLPILPTELFLYKSPSLRLEATSLTSLFPNF